MYFKRKKERRIDSDLLRRSCLHVSWYVCLGALGWGISETELSLPFHYFATRVTVASVPKETNEETEESSPITASFYLDITPFFVAV